MEYTNSIGMKFRLIPPGEFLMGSTPEEIEAALKDVGEDKHWQECIKSEAPQHKVILTQPIYLGVNEVTQAEYEKVMGKNPSHFAPTGMGKEAVAGMETADHPVEMVSWNDAAEFCAKLSKQEKLKPFYFRAGETITPLDGTGYRLPSEAEWEFACRAGTDDEVLDRRQGRRPGAGRLVRWELRRPDACGGRVESESLRAVRHSRQCLGMGAGRVGSDVLRPIPGETCDQPKQPIFRRFPARDPGRRLGLPRVRLPVVGSPHPLPGVSPLHHPTSVFGCRWWWMP